MLLLSIFIALVAAISACCQLPVLPKAQAKFACIQASWGENLAACCRYLTASDYFAFRQLTSPKIP